MVLASLNSARDKAKASATAAELKEIEKAFLLAAIDEGINTLWTEGTLGGSNPTLSTVIADPQGATIAKYLSSPPTAELGNGTFRYDNDNNTAVSGNAGYYHKGANIVINATTLEQRQMLDNMLDGGDGANSGKVTWNPAVTGSSDLLYKIARDPSSF